MKKLLKKVISLAVCLLMVFSAVSVAAAAAEEKYPVIYIEGYGDGLFKSDSKRSEETRIYPTNADVGAIIKEALEPCLKELANGLITDNYDKYCDELYNAVAPIYKDLVLDKNGEASDGSGDGYDPKTQKLSLKKYSDTLSAYRFHYDWRLSPMDVADELKIYIDRVKTHTGKSKVSLVGRCLGGNMISAYLAKYEDHAAESVNSVVMYISSSNGIKAIGGLFSGNIVLNDDNVDRFANYYIPEKELISDDELVVFVTSLITFINEAKLLGLGTDALQKIVDTVKNDLVPRLALSCYASFPSYWAMVDTATYEEARDFIFKGIEDEYAGMIKKIDSYYYEVQTDIGETMKRLEKSGISFGIISKYNLPALPVYAEADEQSDGFTGVEETSFGATSAKLDKVLSKKYIDSLETTAYLSPDNKIDASTCLFPKTTWFIKDITHANFPACIDVLISSFIYSNGAMTTESNETFPQYLQFNAESSTLTPVEGPDPEVPSKGSGESIAIAVVRFFTSLLNFIRRLINGDFKNLFA